MTNQMLVDLFTNGHLPKLSSVGRVENLSPKARFFIENGIGHQLVDTIYTTGKEIKVEDNGDIVILNRSNLQPLAKCNMQKENGLWIPWYDALAMAMLNLNNQSEGKQL